MSINVRAEKVDIDSLQAHPANPRLGDIAAIADSLRVNGQYSPIVVWGETIIAGTHTWKAAKSLGWTEIAITRYEGTEKDALRVLLADNRTSDIATYNNDYLLDLLKSLPDLEGTGYDPAFVDELDGLHNSEGGGVSKPIVDEPMDSEEPETVPIRLGEWFGELDGEIHGIWLASVKEAVGEKKSSINNELRARLDVPTEAKVKKPDSPAKLNRQSPQSYTLTETTLEPLISLKRYPVNPREGDIGAISESLRLLGQYRPIVVNKRNRQILKGNHTAAAASALGWAEIAVVWVDVDENGAAKIVLADNRTADKATYDNDLLLASLKQLPSLDGTGFDPEDFADLTSGKDSTPKKAKVKFKIGDYGFNTTEDIYAEWAEGTEIPNGALFRLGLPITAVVRGDRSE
jgi:hypothetical protein